MDPVWGTWTGCDTTCGMNGLKLNIRPLWVRIHFWLLDWRILQPRNSPPT